MLKLNVGLSRKVGEDNYGSRGASVSLEVELDSGVAGQPDRLRDQIRDLYALARESLAEELNGGAEVPLRGNGQGNAHPANGDTWSHGSGHGDPALVRQATESQVKAIYALAKRNRTDLATLLRDRFHVTRPADLSLPAASSLIDELKNSNS